MGRIYLRKPYLESRKEGMDMEDKKRVECEPGYHRLFALEPFAKEDGRITLVAICTNCGHPVRYDFHLNEIESIRVTE
jgi:hypothetical protein